MQRNLEEVDDLTHDQRCHEIAGILAAGILRLHRRAALPSEQPPNPGKSADCSPNCLEVPDKPRLSGHQS